MKMVVPLLEVLSEASEMSGTQNLRFFKGQTHNTQYGFLSLGPLTELIKLLTLLGESLAEARRETDSVLEPACAATAS